MAFFNRKYDNRLSYGEQINPLVILIAVNMIIFVVLYFFKALSFLQNREGADIDGIFYQNILGLVSLKTDIGAFLKAPWTVLTYSFAHSGFFNLLINMLWLWSFGYIMVDLTGYKKIAPLYIYSSLAGAVGFLLAGAFLPAASASASALFGANTAILAIAVAITTIAPYYKIMPMLNGGFSLWLLSLIYVVIDLATLPPHTPALHIAHLAAGISGFLFVYLLRKGYDGADWMNRLYDWCMNLFNPDKTTKHNDFKQMQFYKSGRTPYKKTTRLTQQKLDEILDKINFEGGYDKLSQEEKDFLRRASEEDPKGL